MLTFLFEEQVQSQLVVRYYSPSHRDLLGHLGNPAILEYQELPKIAQKTYK